MCFCRCRTFIPFFIGHIGDDDAIHSRFFTPGKETVRPIIKYRVQIRQEYERNLCFLAYLLYQFKNIVYARTGFQRTQIRFLDDDAFGNRIRKRNADFYQIGASLSMVIIYS